MLKLVLVPGLCTLAALAQDPLPKKDTLYQKQAFTVTSDSAFGPIGITAAFAGPMATTPGAPYSAQAVTQRLQTLADGNRIVQTTTNSVARDSKGRVYREESLPALGNSNTEPPHLVVIEDPVASVHLTLDSNSKTAVKLPFLNMKRMAEAAMLSGLPPLNAERGMTSVSEAGPVIQIISDNKIEDEAKATKTDLGMQKMEGVMVKGTKVSRTIPAGEVGNDMPIVITTETWYSPDLKLLVMSKSSDPRMGETTYKLTNIVRAEPEASLFQVPSDYTMKDQPSPMLTLSNSKQQ